MPVLSQEQTRFFCDEGYLLIERLIPPADMLPLIREFEEVIDSRAREEFAKGRLQNRFENEPFETRLARLCECADDPDLFWRAVHGKHHKTEGMFQMITHPSILDTVESLIGSEILAHPQFNARAKLPHHEMTVVPWHQDLGYLEKEAEETFMVNFWIPLVDATMKMGALQIIPRSHKWGLLHHEQIDTYLGITESSLPPHDIMDCPLPAGGALVLQHKTVHRSVPNVSRSVRWSLDLRYSDPAQPTGRLQVPGFLARSRSNPQSVARCHQDWLSLFVDSGVR